MIAYRLRWLRRFFLCRYRNFFPSVRPEERLSDHVRQGVEWEETLDTLKKKGVFTAWEAENREKVEACLGLVDRAPQHCLEIGCESGGFGKKLLQKHSGAAYTGLDLRGPQGPFALPGTLVRGDGERLPFADGSFDLLIVRHVLEHIVDVRGFRREMRRVLRPGSRVLAALPLGYFFDPRHRWYYMSPLGWRWFMSAKLGLRPLVWRKMGGIFEEFIGYFKTE